MQRLTPNVEEQLLRLSARVSLGTARGPELVQIASEVLATDITSPAAAELACKYSDITIAEAEPLFRRLLDEIGWPHLSDPVDSGRLGEDVARTERKQLYLGFLALGHGDLEGDAVRSDGDALVWDCTVLVDKKLLGSFHFTSDDSNREASLAELCDYLCEGFLHEEFWGGWPMCPRHSLHPLWATVHDTTGRATWACPTADVQFEVGRLPESARSRTGEG